jgi:predicted RND superfamily exporter protein
MVQMQIGISILCALVGLLIGVLTFNRNRDKDVKNDASKSAVIETKLDNINSGVDSIRIDIKANEVRVAQLSERVTRVEESAKSFHKRLDTIEQKGEN